jgi:hypothetical protein
MLCCLPVSLLDTFMFESVLNVYYLVFQKVFVRNALSSRNEHCRRVADVRTRFLPAAVQQSEPCLYLLSPVLSAYNIGN